MVVLLAEDVDRNFVCGDLLFENASRSSSSRRTWIEILNLTLPR